MDRKTLSGLFEAKGAGRTFTGYAAAWALDLGGDVILATAFQNFLRVWDGGAGFTVPLVDTHDRSSVFKVLGRMVTAEPDEVGLHCRFEVIDDGDGARLLARLPNGAISGLSIGYELAPNGARAPTVGERARWPGVERVLTQIYIREVSVVQSPLNLSARVTGVAAKTDPRQRERDVLEAAFSGASGGLAPDAPRRLALDDRFRRLVVAGL